MRPIVLAVTNDVLHDRRIFRIASTLHKAGYPIKIIGRNKRKRMPLGEYPFPVHRFTMLFTGGFLFYACYNIRLFFYLLCHPAALMVANDLDTLLAVFLASRITRTPMLYDTHEFFTGVPEVENHPVVKKVWTVIEKSIFPRLTFITTVNDSIAKLYSTMYHKKVHVIRNLADRHDPAPLSGTKLGIPPGYKMVILQGTGINRDRGAEEAVQAMQYCEKILFLIVGTGNALPHLKKLVATLNLKEKVRFLPVRPYEKLMQLTAAADLGLSLDKPDHINFLYSLPNKLFDYIQAGIPVLASNLPEVATIIRNYDIGRITDSLEPSHLAKKISAMVTDTSSQQHWRHQAKKAANELCWEKEEEKLLMLYREILSKDSRSNRGKYITE